MAIAMGIGGGGWGIEVLWFSTFKERGLSTLLDHVLLTIDFIHTDEHV